ncbi:neprilysin-2-like, partial [Stegodyphus dumicola]|uniref:neprilysin-2-like n=1 Tax=Stegodyphus dumicola TaxID=202533 RepID=UPI0015B217DE
AYKTYISEREPEARPLAVSDFTPDQLFWIRAAHIWCEKIDPHHLLKIIRTGSRIPQKFRVQGPMSNLPEFAQDFQCTIFDDMNPISKCEIW